MEYSFTFGKTQVTVQDVWTNDDGTLGFRGFSIWLGGSASYGFSEGFINREFIVGSGLKGDELIESFFKNLTGVYEARAEKDLTAVNESLESIGLETINHL